jgi:uncharacterized protein (DUF2345 family)
MATKPFQGSKDNKGISVPNWSSSGDVNNDANEHNNRDIVRLRDGTKIEASSVPGKEIYEIQHRSGSGIKFNPDGSVVIRTHNGEFNLVFGEKRVRVTGAQDITVEGGGSLRVQGDYNQTVMGSVNMAVEGDYNITAKNINSQAREKMDTTAGSQTTKVEGAITVEGGSINQNAQHALNMHSKEGSVTIGAEKGIGINSKDGTYVQSEGEDITFKAKNVVLEASGTATMKGADIIIEATSKASIKGADIETVASGDQKHKAGGDYKFEGINLHAYAKAIAKVRPDPWVSGAQESGASTGTAGTAKNPKKDTKVSETPVKTTNATSVTPANAPSK